MSEKTEIEKLQDQLASKQAAMNGFLSRIQELDDQNRKLVAQRAKQDQRIEELEKERRNTLRGLGELSRRERIAHAAMYMSQNGIMEALGHLGEDGSGGDVAAARAVLRVIAMPSFETSFIWVALHKIKDKVDDETLKLITTAMGIENYERVTLGLVEEIKEQDA
jgi:hypothetical protein